MHNDWYRSPLFYAASTGLLLGLLFLCWYHELIVVHIPRQHPSLVTPTATHKKKISLFFRHTNKWYVETEEIVWGARDENITRIANQWLSIAEQEDIIQKKVSVQTTLLDASEQTAYLSFDRNPLKKEWGTLAKWLFIEGLLKTLRDNEAGVQSVVFLSHHHPINDYHLDFSQPWPVIGFYEPAQ